MFPETEFWGSKDGSIFDVPHQTGGVVSNGYKRGIKCMCRQKASIQNVVLHEKVTKGMDIENIISSL